MPVHDRNAFSRRGWCTALSLAALLAPLGCVEYEKFEGTYVARVGETLVAVVVDDPDGLAVGYACDGRPGVDPAVYAWFGGTLDRGAGSLAGSRGELSIKVVDGALTGELRLDGADPQPFDAPLGTDSALLWGSRPPGEGDVLGGWIFADDGTQRGAVLKRSTGDVGAFTLSSKTATTADFEGLTIQVKLMTAPTVVE